LAALAGFATSCASPGPPRPPSLHLPQVVKDLTAQRVGDRVHLRWTTPARTTDDQPVSAVLTAEVCREMPPAPGAKPLQGKTPACTAVVRTPIKPGPSEAAEPLPAPLTADPVAPLRYRVRILNGDNRSAGDSQPAVAASGKSPEPVAALRAKATREGALLEWTRGATPTIIALERRTAVSAQEKADAKPSDTKPKKNLQLAGSEEPSEVSLLSADPATQPDATDPGGTLDHTAKRGDSYIYRADRRRLVKVGGATLELRSELSSPVTLAMTDTFPPAVPTGLASVPSGTTGKAEIDLSWQPDIDVDLAGYNVYRRNDAGQFVRLSQAPINGPAYNDETVTPGTVYTYRVTAVDASGNESAPSAEVKETAQAPNP
jgi:hypothetical protein